jgi:Trk K+ transport system NAD-binding subunit
VACVIINPDSPFINKTLVEADTPDNEFWIVGIERGRNWISLPRSKEVIQEGDRLVVYGELDSLRQIFKVE